MGGGVGGVGAGEAIVIAVALTGEAAAAAVEAEEASATHSRRANAVGATPADSATDLGSDAGGDQIRVGGAGEGEERQGTEEQG